MYTKSNCHHCYYNVLPEDIFVVYIKKNSGDLYTCNEHLSSCKKFGGVTVLAVQLFNKIKRKKKKMKNLNFSVFPTCFVKMHLFLVNLLFFCMF